MFVPHLLALSLLLNRVNDVSCPAERDIPLVEVIPVRVPPTFHHEDSAEDLTRRGTDAYAPPGTGPSWHKQGLTRASTTFEHKVESLVKQFPDGLTCIYVQKIELRVISEPTVWVANDFPPGTCMYDAVKGHEMKHVHTEENVLASHVGRIREALEETGRNQTVFGPGYSSDVNGRYNAFLKQVDTTIQDEVDVYNYDEAKAQRAVDTLQEYQRIANLCADQLKAMQ